MGISEKVAYLQGLAEGMKLDESTNEGKLLLAILDVLNDMAEEFADVEDEIVDLEDGLDAVSDDLNDLEEFLYDESAGEDDEEDDDDELFVTTCPECEEEVVFDESVLEDGEVICPNCGAKLEFDLSDLANATADEDDED